MTLAQTPEPSVTSNRGVVQQYLDAGFRLVFWPQIGDIKGPPIEGWTTKTYTIDDYREGYRVGILTGHEISPGKFLHDIDIDWADGSKVAQAMLPPTGFVYGRAGKRISHCLYTASEPLTSFRYEDIDKTCLIELRGTKQDGSVGLQSMAPPSIWSNEGKSEQLVFVRQDALAHIDPPSSLKRHVDLSAIAMILARHLGRYGFGHDARLCWAGFGLRAGLSIDDLVKMGAAISVYCENREVDDVREVLDSTAKNLAAKQKKVKGGPALAKLIGDKGKAVIKRIDEWLGRDDPDGIVMRGGQLSEIVDRAEAALVANTEIYQRSGTLVRAIKLDGAVRHTADNAIRREAGAIVLAPVREAWLLEQMGRRIDWFKPNAQRTRADPEAIYARTLLQRGQWSFPVLRGVVPAPTLARDGRIIERAGYDVESGLLIDIAPDTFPSVPEYPTREQALAALHRLSAPLRGFPFQDDAAKSVALSALLTALVRRSLRTAPLHGFDAPVAGTGKSLLAEMPGLLALGMKPASMSQGKTEEEDEKRLSTVLFAGDPIMLIDNCERAISGDFFCSMLTQEMVQARILGLSERRLLACAVLMLATGNNLTLAGDAARRAVVSTLDAQVERPDTRIFDFDCHAELLAARSELVVAGLTILRAYHIAGRPEELTPMGSFDDWSWIRGALVWLGCADPAATRSAILDNDPRKDELIGVMNLWEKTFGSTPTAVADIVPGEPPIPAEHSALHARLIEVACRGGKWSGKSVGWWLRRHKDRIVGGKCFRQGDKTDKGQQWSLVGSAFATGSAHREPGEEADDDIPF
jgi:hypothetical protein